MNIRILCTLAASLVAIAACDKQPARVGAPEEAHASLHAAPADQAPVAAAASPQPEQVVVEAPPFPEAVAEAKAADVPAEPQPAGIQAAAAKVAPRAQRPESGNGAGGLSILGYGSGGGGMGSVGGVGRGVTTKRFAGDGDMAAPPPVREEREQYGKVDENPVRRVVEAPVSTFSIDVDTGSYANVRRMIREGRRPPMDAVRVEELINYFTYDYPVARTSGHPFAVSTEVAPCPWNSQNLLVRIGLRATDVDKAELPPANLVFLVDVSGSMQPDERLPLLKKSLKLLVDQLRPQDRVALVTYASGTRVVLEPTSGAEKSKILRAIDDLQAGGSTAGEAGIQLAYRMAQQGFIPGGINRILLGTDGDFNVGITNFDDLKTLAADKRKTGVSLTTLGFGVGNYNEHLMEQLADAGDGSYAYIDTLNEGQKVLVDQMTQTLAVVAKDVKIQVEFNPAAVAEYRQIGYENRALKREDFNNDKVDAGEVGAGTVVTALYEVTPVGQPGTVDPLRYGSQRDRRLDVAPVEAGELAFLRVRYKAPAGGASQLLEVPIRQPTDRIQNREASADMRFAASVAAFGQLLRGGKYLGAFGWEQMLALASSSQGQDRFGYRGEFVQLTRLARSLRLTE